MQVHLMKEMTAHEQSSMSQSFFLLTKLKPIRVSTRHRASTEHSLTFRVWRYVVIATKLVLRLQIPQ